MSWNIVLQILVTCYIKTIFSRETCEDTTGVAVVSLEGFVPTPGGCVANHIRQALRENVRCRLTSVVVQLPWPNSTDVHQMTPTHVSVQQCEGGCHQGGRQGCMATRTRTREVPVMLGKCGISEGKCDKECATVMVEEHTECGCACQLKWEDCQSATHHLRPELCTCECRDTQAKRKCLDQGRTWTESSCSCGCPISTTLTECPPGFVYDHNDTCACLPVRENKSSLSIVEEETFVDERTMEQGAIFLTWEMIMIITLLAILLILSLITIALIIRVQTLKKRLRDSSQLLVPSTLSGQYLPCTDPCTDLLKPRQIRSGGQSALSDSSSNGSSGDSGTDQLCRLTDPTTDSSLCSDQEHHDKWNSELSEGSSESLATVRQNRGVCHPASEQFGTLQSVRLNKNLAIRPGGTLSRNQHCPSPCNTVKIVYSHGDRTMELNCQVENANETDPMLSITENPLHKFSM